MALGIVTVRIRADIAGLTSGLAQAQAQVRRAAQAMSSAGQAMQNTGRQLSMALTLPIAAFGVAVGRTAAQFEAAMIRVQALSNASGVELRGLTALARELGATTKFTATDAADALGFMSMAGMKATDSLRALPGVLQLAASAGLDMADAADIVTNVLAGYRMGVEDLAHMNDVLVSTFTATNTSLSQLGQAMKYAGPVASAAGVQFETAAAMIGLMGNAGIQGSMAGTSLRGALSRLVAPTDQITEAMEAAGIALHRGADGGVDMVDMIRQLESHSEDAGLFMTIFGQRAGPALAAVVSQGSEALEHLITRLEASGGTAQRIADSYNQGLQGALYGLQSAVEAVGLSFAASGLSGFFEELIRGLTTTAREFANLNPIWLRSIAIVAGLAAAIGPLVWIIGSLIRAVGGLSALLMGPAGLLVLIGGLAVAAVAAVAFGRLKAQVEGVEAAMANAAGPMAQIAQLNQRLANTAGDAATATREQRDALLELMRVQAAQANAEAHRLEAAAAAELDRRAVPEFLRPLANAEQESFGSFGQDNARTRAIRARAEADASFQNYAGALHDSQYQDALPARQAAYLAAQTSREEARAQGVSFEEWAAANRDHARALGDTQAAPPSSRVAVAGEDLIDLQGLDAGGTSTPTQRRAGEIATLQSLSGVSATSIAELDRLTAAQEAMNEAIAGGETLTSEEALAFVDLRDKLQGAIDKQREALQAEQERADASKEFMRGLEQEEAARSALTAAANQGTEAYERMLIIQGLLRDNPALSPDEAAALADNIKRSTDALEAATSRMQNFQQMWDQIGQAVGSAFEKAILDGEKLGDVLKSLARDIAALVLRTLVTEPLANSISNFLSGAFGGNGSSGNGSSGSSGGGWMNAIGSAVMSFFGGFFAEGGKVSPGKWGIAGERGPEPIFGGTTGLTVVPNGGGAGSMHVDARTYVSAPGADPAQLARVEARLAGLQRDLPNIIQGRVANMNSRGRGWAA